MGFDQDPEASDNHAQRVGCEAGDLHRRYSCRADTAEQARDQTLGLIYLLEYLGFIIDPEK